MLYNSFLHSFDRMNDDSKWQRPEEECWEFMNNSSWHLLMSYSSYDTTGRYSSPYGWCNAWWCKASIMYINLYSVVQNTSCSVLQLIVIECSIIELPYGLYSFPDATRHRVTLSTISLISRDPNATQLIKRTQMPLISYRNQILEFYHITWLLSTSNIFTRCLSLMWWI